MTSEHNATPNMGEPARVHPEVEVARLGAASNIVCEVVKSRNSTDDIETIISKVRKALADERVIAQMEQAASLLEKPEPALSVRKSQTENTLFCLHCGKGFKSLKRHLQSNHDQTPEEYRQAFNLPSDYPMVAPAYAEQRSNLAKSMGLGRKGGK